MSSDSHSYISRMGRAMWAARGQQHSASNRPTPPNAQPFELRVRRGVRDRTREPGMFEKWGEEARSGRFYCEGSPWWAERELKRRETNFYKDFHGDSQPGRPKGGKDGILDQDE